MCRGEALFGLYREEADRAAAPGAADQRVEGATCRRATFAARVGSAALNRAGFLVRLV